MKEENWHMMAEIMVDMLPVLQPLQIVMSLVSTDHSLSVSKMCPTMLKLINVDLFNTVEFQKSVVLAICE